MCTLSWLQQAGVLHLVFSRDELLNCVEYEALQTYSIGKQAVLAPSDPQRQGFRVASNSSGLSVCVLNDYCSKGPDDLVRSSGQLVRDLSACETPAEIHRKLEQSEHQAYAPCSLFIFWQRETPVLWRWDGRCWSEHVAPSSPFSTSSPLSELIPRWCRFFFDRFSGKRCWPDLTPEQQLKAHRSRWRGVAWASVAMRPKTRATVSLTRVTVRPGKTLMEYWPGESTETSAAACLELETVWSELPDAQPVPAPVTPPIQLEKMLEVKNAALLLRLQGLKLQLLRWITRVHWLNQQLMTVPATSPRRFPAQVLNRLGVTARVFGQPVMPGIAERPVFLANHPTGGLDGLVLLAWLHNHYPKVRVVVTDLLNAIPALSPLWVPVDRYQSSRKAVLALHQAFADDTALLVFPAGRTARRQQGQLSDFPWHNMAVSMAQRGGRCVVPIHLEATNSWRFYAVAWLRQRLGISLNIEMALLARELLNPATRHFGIFVGTGVSANTLMKAGSNDSERTAWVRAQYEQLVLEARSEKPDTSLVSQVHLP